MSIISYIKNEFQLRRKQSELKKVEHWIWELRDQITSGNEAMQRAELQQAKLHAEIALLTPPDELFPQGFRQEVRP